MSHDVDGYAHDSGHGLKPAVGIHEGGVQEENGLSDTESGIRRGGDEYQAISEEEILGRIAVATQSWSGLIPHPDAFAKYDSDVQEKIIEWTDAQIIDESKRQDRLVDASIRSGRFSSVASLVVNLITIIGSIVLFLVTRDAAAFMALAIPGASIMFNGAVTIINQVKR